MKKYILSILIGLIAYSCGGRYTYLEDEKLSSTTGALVDSTASYLPTDLKFDGETYHFDWNQDVLTLSNFLYKLTSEPLLYNYYQNRDVYRLLLAEKNQSPLIISVNREEKESWIVSKKINPAVFEVDTIQSDSIPMVEDISSDFRNYSRPLSAEEVHAFDSIFQQIDFYHLSNTETQKAYDSYVVLEAHEKNSYWYVYRSADDQSLKKIVDYIRSLTGF